MHLQVMEQIACCLFRGKPNVSGHIATFQVRAGYKFPPEAVRVSVRKSLCLVLKGSPEMMGQCLDKNREVIRRRLWLLVCLFVLAMAGQTSFAQVDQGTILGVVQDDSGAVIVGADVTLVDLDTGLTLTRKANDTGIYVFSPLKIGNYKVSATSPGFETTSHPGLHLDSQQRLNIMLTLHPGAASQTVTVSSAAPLLETQESAVGEVISAQTINNTPLNGRNWVYIAQLTAGVAPPFGNTRGAGSGDFIANGQRAEQNNFILDGVDNNTNLVDFLNGSSFVMRPPPDALSEFSLQTSNFSAEFGHSAGAVMSASIKSGTNQVHGGMWEYLRNTNLDAIPWNAEYTQPYHENQFGATLGFPIWKNHLFYFGDLEANRVSISNPSITTVPDQLMRQGNFSELLNENFTGAPQPIYLYPPGTADSDPGHPPLSCNGQVNVLCPGQINPTAQKILNLYPLPNANLNHNYNNLNVNIHNQDNIFQWDQRLDWNISASDQSYVRYSYLKEVKLNGLLLGPVLDGNGYGGERDSNLAQNFMLSETHIFSPTITNEFRFGYNWGVFKFQQANAYNGTIASSLGLGGVPALGPGQYGLPLGQISGYDSWGSVGTNNESQNVYQILDNVTTTVGNHSLRYGVSFQAVRFAYQYAPASLGQYYWSGTYTGGTPGTSYTGSSVADYLLNQMNSADIANAPNINDAQWYDAAYVEDNWKIRPNLTLNLGIRYDYFQPYKENGGQQGNFVVTGPLGLGTGAGVYQLPNKDRNIDLGTNFLSVLAANNVTVQYVDNERLATAQKTNFAPRIGFALQTDSKTVWRGGFGIFYGGLMAEGNTNLGSNFPFFNQASFSPYSCLKDNCPSLSTPSNGTGGSAVVVSPGITVQSGIQPQLNAGGLINSVSYPSFHATDVNIHTPYTMNYSLSFERALSPNLAATISYVGNVSRHLSLYGAPNTVPGLFRPGTNTQLDSPFPTLGGIGQIHYAGVSTYNSLQAKLEKRYSHGLSFLATYTWAHSLDDASDAGGNFGAVGDRNLALIPFIDEFSNSVFDVHNRFTINGNYELPFGRGKAFLNNSRLADETVGGWSTSLTYAAQSGSPFSVSPNISTAAGGGARAYIVRDPFAGGGAPNSTNPGITCAPKARTKMNYFNPCALANPVPGEAISDATHPVGSVNPDGVPVLFQGPVRDEATAIRLLGGKQGNMFGPGHYQVNMSLFKTFATWREQNLQFRADGFNILNHPTLGTPNGSVNSNGGLISGPKFFQNNTPDARFFQLSLKYAF